MNRLSNSLFILFASLFTVPAYADSAAAPNPFGQVIMLGVFIGLMWLLLIRPQTKRQKEHRDLVSTLNEGDEVVTNGGLTGKITKLDEQFVTLTIASGVDVMMQKPAITAVLPKGTLTNLN